jgi:hypothetical protein
MIEINNENFRKNFLVLSNNNIGAFEPDSYVVSF